MLCSLMLVGEGTFAATLRTGDIIVSQQSGPVLKVDPRTGAQEVLYPSTTYLAGVKLSRDRQHLFLTDASDHGVRRVNVATGAGAMLTSGNHLNDPQSVAIDRDGNLLVTSFLADKLVKVSAVDGQQTVLVGAASLSEPLGTAWYRPGKLIVGNYRNGSLALVDTTTGEVTPFAPMGTFRNPYYLDVDAKGMVYVGNHGPLGGNKIQKYNPRKGTVVTVAEGGSLSSPLCAMVEDSGKLIVANHISTMLLRVDPEDGLQLELSSASFLGHTRSIDIVRDANGSTFAFVPPGGFFTNSVSVDVVSREDGELRYTMDGSEPTMASAPYRGPLIVTREVTIKGRLFAKGQPLTGVVAARFQAARTRSRGETLSE